MTAIPVLVSLKSTAHRDENSEDESMSMLTSGQLEVDDTKAIIRYEESIDESLPPQQVDILVEEETVTMNRGGAYSTQMVFRLGCRYEGQYQDGVKCGKGTFTWPDGSTYEGEFRYDVMHGKGIHNARGPIAGENRYEGRFYRDQKCGFGVMRYASQLCYRGTWLRDQREGVGVLTWPNGSHYIGFFHWGYAWGPGIFVDPNGTGFIGWWNNNNGQFVSNPWMPIGKSPALAKGIM